MCRQRRLPVLLLAAAFLAAGYGRVASAEAQESLLRPATDPGVERAQATDLLPQVGARYLAVDSLDCRPDENEDAEACLRGLRWKPGQFTVEVEAARNGFGDRTLFFPSPMPSGDAANSDSAWNRVAVEWYAAKDDVGRTVSAPAVVVVHESGRNMPIGRLIARSLRAQGLHALLLQLPGYGLRRGESAESPEAVLSSLQQGIADARRARDAAVVLPGVAGEPVGLQGTSLGGFVACTVAGLDSGYDRVFILLAGGNLKDVILQGKKDAAKIRRELNGHGIDDDRIVEFARKIEPLRLAHRASADQTWLYNGYFDDVVPRASSYAFAEAAGLGQGHHVELPADHYTGIIFLPAVIRQIREAMTSDSLREAAAVPGE